MFGSALQRLICLSLLAAYAVAGTSLGSVALITFAAIEGGHAVSVTESCEGTQVILHHHSLKRAPNLADHSSAGGTSMARMSKPAGAGDHRVASPHGKAAAKTASDEEERHAQGASAPNHPATNRLASLMHSSQGRNVARPQSHLNLDWPAMRSHQQVLASVQMLV